MSSIKMLAQEITRCSQMPEIQWLFEMIVTTVPQRGPNEYVYRKLLIWQACYLKKNKLHLNGIPERLWHI